MAKVKGLLGSAKVTEREMVKLDARPPEAVMVRLLMRGTCIPKRGSGPCVRLRTMPSGGVTTRLPSVPICIPRSEFH